MNRAELEHAIRAACDVAEETDVYVLGSQAILGEHPDAPEGLRQSVEVDVSPKHHPERADTIDGALGELSRFHRTFGFAGLCLEAHDLAASKLVAFRDKDREFVRILLREGLVAPETLLDRIDILPTESEQLRGRLTRWVGATADELSQ